MILTTEAIVLASQKYGDSSKIATLFTEDFGIMKAIAKGSYQMKNKFGSSLQVLSYININFYNKPEGHLQLLSNAEIIRPNFNLSKSFEHITIGFALCETILKTLDEHYKNSQIFLKLVQSLNLLDSLPQYPFNILIKFLLDLAKILGFEISIINDESIESIHELIDKSSSKKINHNYTLNIENGNFKITNFNANNNTIEQDLLKKIYEINILPISEIEDIEISIPEMNKIMNLMSKYYHFHLDKYFYLESMRLLLQ
ncbi:MAG: DNA repair protein RecO [Chloroherpetonaceae bacterium]|jgi:DNA repair protein RecO (recombination protein O)|nr:DNA repair protein RecO [bacterium]